MKKLFIFIITVMASANINAQIEEGNWYVTPKAGVSVADLTGKLYDEAKAEGTYDATLRPVVGFTAGVDFQYAMTDNLALAFGLGYVRGGGKTDKGDFHLTLDYVNVPVMLNFYPIKNAGLALKAGVQVGFLSHKKGKIDGKVYSDYSATVAVPVIVPGRGLYHRVFLAESEFSKGFNKVDFSIPLAVSYEISNIQLEARYNLGLTKVMKDDAEASKNSIWQFTLGYKFDLGD